VKRPLSPSETTPELATEKLRLRSILLASLVLLGVLYLHLLSALFAGLAGFVLYRRVRDFTGPAKGSLWNRALRWLLVTVAVAGPWGWCSRQGPSCCSSRAGSPG
jgi:hypothetical protein